MQLNRQITKNLSDDLEVAALKYIFQGFICVRDRRNRGLRNGVPRLPINRVVHQEGFCHYSCRKRFVNKIDIIVLFGGGSDWVTGWTVRGSNPSIWKRFFFKMSKPVMEPPQLPMLRVTVLFVG